MISWACGTLVHVCQLRENMAHLTVILTGDDLGMIERPYAIRPIITASACYLESVNGAGFEPPWDPHSNTATKSLVLRDMKATPSPRLGGSLSAQTQTPSSNPRNIERIRRIRRILKRIPLSSACCCCTEWHNYTRLIYSNTRNDAYHLDLPAGLIHKLRIDGVRHLKSFGTSHES